MSAPENGILMPKLDVSPKGPPKVVVGILPKAGMSGRKAATLLLPGLRASLDKIIGWRPEMPMKGWSFNWDPKIGVLVGTAAVRTGSDGCTGTAVSIWVGIAVDVDNTTDVGGTVFVRE